MKAATTPKGPECKTCKQSFRTNSKLVKHSLKTCHGADRCCVPCSRVFGTKEGLEAHSKSSIHIVPSSNGASNNSPKVLKSPAAPIITKKKECTICHALFQTKAELADHCLRSGHNEDRCCRPCQRLFGTKEALEAHEKSLGCKTSTRQDSTIACPSTSQQEHSMNCRGNNYRRIPQQEHTAVLEKLISQCHSASTLQRHGYNVSQAGASEHTGGPSRLTRGTDDEILPLPRKDRSRSTRKAVAIDCEMVGVEGGASELVSLTVIDFLTGEQIIHSLVKPRRPIVDWRTNIHGISPAGMTIARAKGLALDGWQTARAELFKHIDEDTVLVGHALNYDLAVLHVHPARVVDSIILASNAIFGTSKGNPRYWGLGLKNVCSGLLSLNIRENAPVESSKIHDDLEDALATREVVLCCIQQSSMYDAWVLERRKAFFEAQTHNSTRRRQKTRRQQQAKKAKANDTYNKDSEDEILRWEDVIDYEIWPKSPPDSD